MRVKLKGSVMQNDYAAIYRRWGYTENCCPADVERAVEQCPEGEELVFEINSPGGSVYSGFEMYSAIRQHKGKTAAEVYGIAGSAASVILTACDEVRMSPVANVMIHRSSTYAEGNSQVMGETSQMLDTIDESILNAYEEKVKGRVSREELKELMDRETFFTAEEAVELGLADGILPRPAEKGEASPETAVACMKELALAAQCPTVEELMARERAECGDSPLDRVPLRDKHGENTKQSETPCTRAAEDTAKKQKGDEGMEITNVEQLREAYPELTAELSREAEARVAEKLESEVERAVTAERERIAGIDSVAVAGFEELIASAKADPAQNAGSVAMAIIKAQKEQGNAYLAAVKRDAAEANGVPAAEPATRGEETAEEAARAAVKGYFGNKEEK